MTNTYFNRLVDEVCDLAENCYRLGYDERNGGNISILLSQEEASDFANAKIERTFSIKVDVPNLDGSYFLVTGTGIYFKNIKKDPYSSLGVLRIDNKKHEAQLVWGFKNNNAPTSEFSTHLLNHSVRLDVDPLHRVVIHCHPLNLVGLTFVLPDDEDEITRVLWKTHTESIVVFPEGIGLVPWMVCGGEEIGKATSLKIKEYRLVLWSMHGAFGTGRTIDEAFGLIETAEKVAQLYFLVKNDKKREITTENLKALANAFNLNYKKII